MKVGSGCGEFCQRGESANLSSVVILVKKKKKEGGGDDGQSGRGSSEPEHQKLATDTRELPGLPGKQGSVVIKLTYGHFAISSFLFPFFYFMAYIINKYRKTYII